MGILLRDDQASYRSNAKGMIFPISDAGLELIGVFGDTLAASCRNFASGKAAFTPVGTPTVNANSIELQGTAAFLQTDMAHSHDLTLIVISRPLDELGTLLLSNYQSKSQVHAGQTVGASLYSHPGSAPDDHVMSLRATYASTDGSVSVASGVGIENDIPVGQFQFHCGRFSAATNIRQADNLTTAKSALWPNETRAVDFGETFRIGAGYTNAVDYRGRSELVAVIGMSRVITDAEMTTLYKFWKGYCERRGILI
ncbi:hypothetical protein [Burkholderia cepacia]|uniref:hypothetical protein n=1 Tax=Burkholderia cepacia TaxID=292 RepID=UPI003EE0D1F8